MKLITLCFLLVPLTPAAKDTIEISGEYLRYEGGEYESAFIPCAKNEVWSLNGGAAYSELVQKSRASPTNKYGETFFTLQLTVTPIDKQEYPNSHYAATATVESIVENGKLKDCKEVLPRDQSGAQQFAPPDSR